MTRKKSCKPGDPLNSLELQILQLKSEGLTEKAIDRRISEEGTTVGATRASIYEKTGLYREEQQTGTNMPCKDVRAVYLALEKKLIAGPRAIQGVHQSLDRLERRGFKAREIIGLLPLGLSNAQIGDRLGLTAHQVKFFLHEAYAKLGVSGRIDLMVHTTFTFSE